MRLTQKSKYAVRALVELALNEGESPLGVAEIARRQHIPERFLEQIFGELRRASVLESRRGAHGGYTLARGVVADAGHTYRDVPEGMSRSLGEVYLEPHRAYVREIEALRQDVEVRGMAHITGGGLPANLPRALGGPGARLYASSWEEPPVFALIRALGGVAEDEMRRVFNLGVGFCAVVDEKEVESALVTLRGAGCTAWRIGEVVEGGEVEFA